MSTYADIQKALKQPFPIETVEFRPGSKGSALTYVGVWAYIDRLEALVPNGELTITEPTVLLSNAGEVALSIGVLIGGVLHYGVSDLDSPSSAYAQALKRACAVHGLGRYLYDSPFLGGMFQGMTLTYSKESVAVWVYDQLGLSEYVPATFRADAEGLPGRYTGPSSYSAPTTQTATPRAVSVPSTPVQPASIVSAGGVPTVMAKNNKGWDVFTPKKVDLLVNNGFTREQVIELSHTPEFYTEWKVAQAIVDGIANKTLTPEQVIEQYRLHREVASTGGRRASSF